MLHRKRTGLIPVLDSVVVAHYLNRLGERTLLTRSWEDRAAAKEAGRLAMVRVLHILVCSQTESGGYYRAESASGQIDLT